MDSKLTALAHAFLGAVKDLPEADMAAATDAACAMVAKEGLGLRAFTDEVARLLPQYDSTASAALSTVTGKAGADASALVKTLEKELNQPVELTEHANPALLGGAVLRVGDDRFDYSVRGALDQAKKALSSNTISHS